MEYDIIYILNIIEKNRITYEISQIGGTYHVKYTFVPRDGATDFEYYEWVDSGILEYPTTMETLELLKNALEQKIK